jgi:hypothetical protein
MESPPPIKDAPAFDFYPERWLAGVAEFSDAEQLSYLRLLCHQWLRQGLPAETAYLRRLAGKGVTEALLAKFPIDPDGLRRNPRLETVRADQRERIARKRLGGAMTNAKRHGIASLSESDRELLATSPAGRKLLASEVASDTGATSPASRHHPPPTTHPLERKSTPARMVEVEGIANAYCRQDAPIEVRECIAADLDAGTSYDDFRRAVNSCMEHIRAAPGGASNQYVPKALTFFQQRQWRSPEAFAERWKRSTGRAGSNGERVVLTTPNGWGTPSKP